MSAAACVPAACLIVARRPRRTGLNPDPQLALYQPAQAIGNRPLASIAAMQIDQRGPRAASSGARPAWSWLVWRPGCA
jgi:hypothetical protein